jgi:hypothetical protein
MDGPLKLPGNFSSNWGKNLVTRSSVAVHHVAVSATREHQIREYPQQVAEQQRTKNYMYQHSSRTVTPSTRTILGMIVDDSSLAEDTDSLALVGMS